MKMKLAELISVATEKTGKPLRWWTFGEPGVFIRSLSLRMSLLIALRRDFCYFLCGAPKIVLQRLDC